MENNEVVNATLDGSRIVQLKNLAELHEICQLNGWEFSAMVCTAAETEEN